MSLVMVSGSASEALAINVAREFGLIPGKVEIRRFPDGEKYVRVLEEVRGGEAVVIQSAYHRPDEFLFEYFLLVDALRGLGVRRVVSVIPYFAYARQDERFNPGEALSLETVSKLIEIVGTDILYTIDMHLHRVRSLADLFKIPARNLSAMPLLGEYIKRSYALQRPLVVGPDEEAEQWARIVSEVLGTDYDVLQKKRLGPEKVKIETRTARLDGRDVVLVDDIISTGGTIAEAARALRDQGTGKIIVACTHPVLVQGALPKLHQAGVYAVVATDTVPSPISYVTVAPLIANAIRGEIGL